jgi:hypothetical protein
MFATTVLKEIFGRKIEEVTGNWTKLYIAESQDSFSSPNTIVSTEAIQSSRVR